MPKKVPDFAKLHAKEFGKMDSLDVYLSKKKDRSSRNVAKERFEKAREITREHRDARTRTDRLQCSFGMNCFCCPRNLSSSSCSLCGQVTLLK